MISIRRETNDDADAIELVTRQAFAASDFGHNGEAELIRELRTSCDHYLSLVATMNQEIVGHALFTDATLTFAESEMNGMGLAPLSVLPRYQRNGIGSQLVQAGLAQLAKRGNPFCAVIGHPEFYKRLNFKDAAALSVVHGFAGIPQEFLLLHCSWSKEDEVPGQATLTYAAAFGSQF